MRFDKPSLRTLLFLAFLTTSIVPVIMLSWWVIDSARESEFSAVNEKHLLVAKNLTSALSRYAQDISAILQYFASLPDLSNKDFDLELLRSQNISSIRIFNKSAELQKAFSTQNDKTLLALTNKQFDDIKNHFKTNETIFLPVQLNKQSEPRITIITPIHETHAILVAELETDYFFHLQSNIRFGKLGHAAIVDQAGNVLAHPKASWTKQAKNISKVSAVRRMMNRETGVEQFYSPAKKSDMIAGFSFVEETGWGAMVPQPIRELEIHVEEIKQATLGVSFIGLLIASLISWTLADRLARPTRQLAKIARNLSDNEKLISSTLVSSYTREQYELSESFNKMTQALQQKNNELLHNLQHDSLTGLANQTLLRKHIIKCINNDKPFIFILIDLNDFKDINDYWSHAHGDELLKRVAKRLLETISSQGLVSRIGGDEFAIVLNPDIHKKQAETISQSIKNELKRSYQLLQETLRIDCSSGLACYPQDASNMPDLLQCADLAMYAAKQKNNTSFYWYSISMRAKLDERIKLTQALRSAIQQKEFTLHYQPKVDAKNFHIRGFEALVRWQHPERGLIYPDHFISLAENTGLIIPLGELILELACQGFVRLNENFSHNHPIAINLSARQFEDTNLVDKIHQTLTHHKVPSKNIEFEVTESILARDPLQAKETLKAIREYGCTVSIDDFGTGQSSLARLKDLEIDKIKIDKAFIQELSSNSKALGLLENMVKIGKTIEVDVVVEGVENLTQLNAVQASGCNEIQGFIFSQAVDLETALQLVKQKEISPNQISL